MGTLRQHIERHVPHTVTDMTPAAISERAESNNFADHMQEHNGGTFVATEENGVIGDAHPRPGRINARLNGIKVS